MKLYNQDATCVKCGSSDINSHLIEKGNYRGFQKGYCKKEVISRTCQCCHYQWDERPLDQMTSKEVEVLSKGPL